MLNNYGLSIQSEDPEAAAASFREVLALPGQHENADAYFNLGNALSDTAAHAEAVEAYGAAAKLAPDDGEFAAAHGGALLQAGAAAEAVAALRGVCGALRSAPPVKRMKLRLKSPKIPQKLQILTARPTRFRWRRTGAIELEANVIMRMWNDHPVPLKIRALNTTILLRSLFSEERYAVGYKTA